MRTGPACGALVAATLLAGGCSDSSTPEPGVRHSAAPSSSVAPSPSTSGPRTTGLSEDLPVGPLPRLPYLVGKPLSRYPWRLVRTDRTSLTLPVIPGSFASSGRGLVTLVTGESSYVYVIDERGRADPPVPTSSTRLAVSRDGGVVGWAVLVRHDRVRPVLRYGDGSYRRFAPGPPDLALVGIVGTGCRAHHARCRPVVVEHRHTLVLRAGGARTLAPRAAVDVRADLSTLVSRDRRGLCSSMWSGTGHRLWRDCSHAVLAFSPSGASILATDGYGSSFDGRRVSVLDDRGRNLVSYRVPRGVELMGATWEDDRHLLVRLGHDWTSSYVVRLSVGGRASVVFASQGRIRSLVGYELPTR